MATDAETKNARRTTPSAKRERKLRSACEALSLLFTHMGGRDQPRLVQLWRHWDMVMGDYLASLARPLGHKDRTLLIGSEDAMAMQELTMQSAEILDRVNAFMGDAYFNKIKAELMRDRPDLSAPKPGTAPVQSPPAAPRAQLKGMILEKMKPDSPVRACYEAWLKQKSATGNPPEKDRQSNHP